MKFLQFSMLASPLYGIPTQSINYGNIPVLNNQFAPNNNQQWFDSTPHKPYENNDQGHMPSMSYGQAIIQPEQFVPFAAPWAKRDKEDTGGWYMPWNWGKRNYDLDDDLDDAERELVTRALRNPEEPASSFLGSNDMSRERRAMNKMSLTAGNLSNMMKLLKYRQNNSWANKRARMSKQVLSYTSGKPIWHQQKRNAVNFRATDVGNSGTRMLSPELINMIMQKEFGKRAAQSWYEDTPILENVF